MTEKLRIIEAPITGYNVERLITEPDGNSLMVPYWKRICWCPTIEDADFELTIEQLKIYVERQIKIIKEVEICWSDVMARLVINQNEGQAVETLEKKVEHHYV